jgi:zinc protease
MSFLFLIALTCGAVSAKITLPEADEIKLDNGLVVQVIERHDLPLFSLQMTFRAGSTHDPEGKEGLASLSSDMLMRGTTNRTAKQIADEVAFGGGTLANFCGRTSAGFAGEFLSSQGENAFEILADLVLNSNLPEDEFDKTKARTLGGLQSRKEDPRSVANDGIYAAILGENRYAHFTGGTTETVEALTRQDLVDFIAGHYTPDNCILVVCGDVSAETVAAWVDKCFGTWTGSATVTPADQPFPEVTGTEVIIYDKEDATQTQIRIGGNGIPLNSPDFPALEVARTIYGGSFTSRLMDEIRVNRGLTYTVRLICSEFTPGGLSYVYTFTESDSVGTVVDIILDEAASMMTELVPEEEHQGGINYQCGTYPLDFETNDDLAGIFSDLWLTGVDKSYFEDYQERLRAITPEQSREIARKYFPGDKYKLVLVGKADQIRSQVEKYGPVTVTPLAE